MAKSVEHPLTLNFGSGHDLRVVGLSPESGSMLSIVPAKESLSLLLPLSPAHALSLKQTSKLKKKKKVKTVFSGIPCL